MRKPVFDKPSRSPPAAAAGWIASRRPANTPRGVNVFSRRLAAAGCRRWTRQISCGPSPWQALERELDRWQPGGAVFWWRDDDAHAAGPALERLLAERRRFNLPLALAVIPARLDASLRSALRRQQGIWILQHGWDHENHGGPGEPKGELTSDRAVGDVILQLRHGRACLEAEFGDAFLPVLVPPFNTVALKQLPAVRDAGFRYLSTADDFVRYDFPDRNVHAEVIDWQEGAAADPQTIVQPLLAALRLRRYGIVRRDRPIGVLTHHLDHDETVWSRTGCLLDVLRGHRAVAFPSIKDVFS